MGSGTHRPCGESRDHRGGGRNVVLGDNCKTKQKVRVGELIPWIEIPNDSLFLFLSLNNVSFFSFCSFGILASQFDA